MSDSFDPDKLHLSKQQIIAIGDELVRRWMQNPKANAKMILATKAAQFVTKSYSAEAIETYYKEFWKIAFEVMQKNAMAGDPALNMLKQVKENKPIERPIPRTPPAAEKKKLNFTGLLGNGAMKD